jgi:transposase
VELSKAHEGEPSAMQVTTIGLDLAKQVFQLHGIDAGGRVVLRKRLSRSRLLGYFANLPRCVVGMEACGGAHFWARELVALGHAVRLMPPSYVRPYVRRNKHDPADAEACCEAVTRPAMRFVPIKSVEQQSALLLHRGRDLLVRQRTQLVNALRGHLAEFGIVAAQGITRIGALLALVADPADHRVPPLARAVLALVVEQLHEVNEKIAALERRIVAWHGGNEVSQRLATIPGVGPITATALVATVGDPAFFTSARHFTAWLGLTPRQHASGDKVWQGGISKRGSGYLRRLLIHGARSILRWGARRPGAHQRWLDGLLARRPGNVVTVALASKTARIAWAVMVRGTRFAPAAA